MTTAFALLTLTWFCCALPFAHGQPEKMRNIGYLAGGYHIYYGNPRTTEAGVDPGFTTHAGPQIFEQIYSDKTTGDGRYSVPDSFTILSDVGCHLTFSARSTYKSSEYSKLLQTDVSANFGGFGVAFSASTDYKHFEEQTQSSSMKVVQSTVDCTTYSASRGDYARASFTHDFASALATLPATYGDGRAYFDFFDHFGTHVLTGAVLGSRFGFTSYFSEEQWKHVENTGVNVTVAAQYEGIVKAGGSIGVGKEHDAQQAFNGNASSFELITLGSKPISGDETAWAQAVISEPMPIRYTLDSICEVISTDMSVKANCERAALADEYCAKRLRDERHDVKECSASLDNECLWHTDCSPNQICSSGKCKAPTEKGNLRPVERFWDWKNHGATFHFAPAWDHERVPRTGPSGDMFWAFSAPAKDSGNTGQHTVPINHYFNHANLDSTFHPAPAWGGEELAGERVYYAYAQPAAGTTPINRYWFHGFRGKSSFHAAPAFSGERSIGDGMFYAFRKSPACSAHAECGHSSGDCCPAADGTWLRCCDSIMSENEIQI